MRSKDRNIDSRLEEALSQLREEKMGPAEIADSARQVEARLAEACGDRSAAAASSHRIAGCQDFQSLIGSYLSGELSAARRTLLEDHSRDCPACRKALWSAQSGHPIAPPQTASTEMGRNAWVRPLGWAAAATLLVAFGLFQLGILDRVLGPELKAVALQGQLFQVSDSSTPLLVEPGSAIHHREVLRTSPEAGALIELGDGSRIEIRERSQLSLDQGRSGTTIQLARGSVIVQAAQQRTGRLTVTTADCLVSVKGTVFAVTAGARGSRVSVIQGEVWVDQGRNRTVLLPGEQLSTRASLQAVPVATDFAWSSQIDQHIAVMKQLASLHQQFAEQVASLGLRYTSDLLPLVPADTKVFAAFPNISDSLADAYSTFRQKVDQNPVLQSWWLEHQKNSEGGPDLEELIARVQRLGNYLGDEIVLAIGGDGGPAEPMLLAEVRQPEGLLASLADDLARLNGLSEQGPKVLLIRDPDLPVEPAGAGMIYIWVDTRLLAASPSIEQLRHLSARSRGQVSTPPPSDFQRQLYQAYSEGVSWLLAIDMQQLQDGEAGVASIAPPDPMQERLGISELRAFVAEQKSVGGRLQNRATFHFSGKRQGLSSWLAVPSPMGALDFVTPDTYLTACLAIQSPATVVDDLLEHLQGSDSQFWQELLSFQEEQGVDFRNDLAAALGREFLFALDGPVLPKPSWKVVAEVHDPARLQQALGRLVEGISHKMTAKGTSGLFLTREETGGQTFFKISRGDDEKEVHYLFHQGYLLVASSRAVLIQTLQNRYAGFTLARSPEFQALLPADQQANCSGLLYQNLGSMVKGLAGYVPDSGRNLTPDQAQSLAEAVAASAPLVLCLQSGVDRITISGGDMGGYLSGLTGLRNLSHLLEGGFPGMDAGDAFDPTTR
jgi:hypothetical protein